MRAAPALGALALLVFAPACATMVDTSPFARSQHASDIESYTLRRVGVLPFTGPGLDVECARVSAEAFASALAREASFEVRLLDVRDLEEVPASETFRRGWTRPATPIELARRYGLDAVVVGDVRRAQWFPPQRLELAVDLIAVETGLPIWTSAVELDSGDERVRTEMRSWYRHQRRGDDARGESWELYLLSPRLFFTFAAEQLARGF